MTGRLDAALLVVPELAAHAPTLRDLYDAAGAVPGGDIQRVHGDLHLGEVLLKSRLDFNVALNAQ